MNRKRDLKLSLKISLTLGSIIFLSIFIYLIIYIHNSQKYENEVMGKENIAMLHSIDSSLTTVFENANNYSKIIYVFLTIFLYLLKCPQSLIL